MNNVAIIYIGVRAFARGLMRHLGATVLRLAFAAKL
jgi:hypothetical protein